MKNRLIGLGAAVILGSVVPTGAALISPTAATTTMGSGIGSNLVNTINGVGLSSLTLTATHDATGPGNSWISDGGALTGDITFEFGAVVTIQGFSFWNQNAGGPGTAGSPGIRDLVISSSLDNVTFTPIIGAPDSFAHDSNAVGLAQPFSFAPVKASFVKFSVTSNHGDATQTGFAEVQFDRVAASVPDSGSTLALLGTLLLGFAAVRRSLSLL